ncbi:MAG: muconolactone Delta-isomerase family protein [Dehalococcoidia bacterium]
MSKGVYLVQTDDVVLNLDVTFAQIAPTAVAVMTSLEKLVELRKKGVILGGGVPSGRKSQVFLVAAESNDEVTEMLEGLPMWGYHNWNVTPLESWEHHVGFLKSAGEAAH